MSSSSATSLSMFAAPAPPPPVQAFATEAPSYYIPPTQFPPGPGIGPPPPQAPAPVPRELVGGAYGGGYGAPMSAAASTLCKCDPQDTRQRLDDLRKRLHKLGTLVLNDREDIMEAIADDQRVRSRAITKMQTTFKEKVANSHMEILESVKEQQKWIYGILAGVALSFLAILALAIYVWRSKLNVSSSADTSFVNGNAIRYPVAPPRPHRPVSDAEYLHYSLL